jgi:hypothetical protein
MLVHELKNFLSVHALYRFSALGGHKFEFGILDLLNLVGQVVAAVKAVTDTLTKIGKLPSQIESTVRFLEHYIS